MELERFSDHAGLDELNRAPEAALRTALVAHLGSEFLVAGEISHHAGFPHGLGKGLLAIDVLAHLHRHDAGHSVDVIRCGNSDAVDLIAHFGEHFPEIRVFLGIGEPLGHGIEPLLVNIAETDDLSAAFRGVESITLSFACDTDTADLETGVEILTPNDGWGSKCGSSGETGEFQKFATIILGHVTQVNLIWGKVLSGNLSVRGEAVQISNEYLKLK